MTLHEIARALSAEVIGDGALVIERIVHPADARHPSDLAVAMSDETYAALANCHAGAAVISARSRPPVDQFKGIVVTEHARPSMAILTRLFAAAPMRVSGVDPAAVVAEDAIVEPGASIGPFAVIGARTRIGAETVVFAHVTIGADVTVGRDGVIHAGARIADRVVIGDRVIVHANAVIGSDGFSFLPGPSGAQRVHSLGTVFIGDDVAIGAGTTIDRATMAATKIGRGTKIDNLVQIAHNVTIGENCLICGMVGISGSVRIGDRVQIGGGAGIADHVTVGSDVMIAAGSGVGSNVADGAAVSGYPARKHERTLEGLVYLGRQKALHEKVGALQLRLEQLERAAERDEP